MKETFGWGWILAAALIVGLVWLAWACRKANATDWGHASLNLLDGFNRLFCRSVHGMQQQWLDLPDTGPAIVASNHVSGLDPLLLIACSRRPLRFLIAREQYERFGFQWLFRAVGCIPVDRSGRGDVAFRAALQGLAAGEVIALFPQGKIRKDTDPPVRLKTGVARLARSRACPLYPVRIGGVRAQGQVVLSVFIPSRVRLRFFPPLEGDRHDTRTLLDRLQAILDGHGANHPVPPGH